MIQNYFSNCYSDSFEIKINSMKETNQLSLSCLNEKNNLLNFVIFNENFKYLNNYIIKIHNYNFGYSIIYSYGKEKYLLISEKCQEISLKNFSEPKIIITNEIGSNNIIKLRKTEETNNCGNLQKCQTCTEESISKNLCLTCNTQNNYFQINPNSLNNQSKYVDCYNFDTKPKNFYFEKNTNYYEPCYWTCGSCDYGGDGNVNNCTTCAMDYTKEPEIEGSTNCVVSCKNFYYYTSYGQYKCSSNPQCPEENNLLIREKKKMCR